MIESNQVNSEELSIAPEAVADSMLIAQSMLFEHRLRSLGVKDDKHDMSHESLKLIFFLATEGQCTTASKIALTFLHGKYRMFFDRMALLTSHDDSERFRENWGMHQYFLVRDLKGMWYAGSPANDSLIKGQGASRSQSAVSVLWASDNLSDILQQIRQTDGGVWPSLAFIEQTFSIPTRRMPQHMETSMLPSLCRDIFRYKDAEGSHDEVRDCYLFSYRNGRVSPPEEAYDVSSAW